MPVKLKSKIVTENAEARIEIIPLIDIMFFLLAAFMLVSLSMVNVRGVKVNLPSAKTASGENGRDAMDISVDRLGAVFLNRERIGDGELVGALRAAQRENGNVRVFISGDRDARNGEMVHVLDLVRSAGIERVIYEVRSEVKQ